MISPIMRTAVRQLTRLATPWAGALLGTLVFVARGHAQQAETSGSLGVRAGVATYYGELNDQLFPARPELRDLGDNLDYLTWGIDLERYFGNGWGVGLLYTNAQFSASDRRIDWDGELVTDADDFRRALNVSTSVNDLAVYGMWSANDGKVLSETAVLAPFFKLGFGVTRFEPRGDLFTLGDRRYLYGEDGRVFAEPVGFESPLPLPEGVDGDYETDLRELRTNGPAAYNKYAYHVLGGVGLNLRLSETFALQVETLARLTTTDDLDDVSGPFQTTGSDLMQYASNPTGRQDLSRGEDGNDAYAMTTVTARFYFGDRTQSFRTPFIVLGDLPLERTDTAEATSRLFRFEPIEPLPEDSARVEPLVFRPQGALTVARPPARAAVTAVPDDDAPAIEDIAVPDYVPPVFDTAAFGGAPEPSDADTTDRRPAVIVTTFPEAVSDTALAIDDSLARAVDSLAGIAPLDTGSLAAETIAPFDSTAVFDSTDVLDAISEPAEADSALLVRLDSLDAATALASDSVAVVAAAREVAVDSLDRLLGEAPPGDSVRLVMLQSQIDSLAELRERDLRYREDLERQRRAATSRLLADDGRRREPVPAQSARRPRRTVERELPADGAGREDIRALRLEQAELRREVDRLAALLAAERAGQTVVPTGEARPAATPSVRVAAPSRPAGRDSALLVELRELRAAVDGLRGSVPPPIPVPATDTRPTPGGASPPAAADPRIAVVEALRDQPVRRVFFEHAEASVGTTGLNALQEVAALALRYPTHLVVRLEGFASRTGSQSFNAALSERRVRAVRSSLEQLGVPASQIELEAQGEDFDASDLAYGRRVEVRLGIR